MGDVRKGQVQMRGKTLRGFRTLKGYSQAGTAAKATQELRDLTGDPDASISESLIALIETDRRQPSALNAEAIARALGVQLDWLADVTLAEPAEAAS